MNNDVIFRDTITNFHTKESWTSEAKDFKEIEIFAGREWIPRFTTNVRFDGTVIGSNFPTSDDAIRHAKQTKVEILAGVPLWNAGNSARKSLPKRSTWKEYLSTFKDLLKNPIFLVGVSVGVFGGLLVADKLMVQHPPTTGLDRLSEGLRR